MREQVRTVRLMGEAHCHMRVRAPLSGPLKTKALQSPAKRVNLSLAKNTRGQPRDPVDESLGLMPHMMRIRVGRPLDIVPVGDNGRGARSA